MPIGVWAERRGSAPSFLSSPWKFGLAPYLWLPAMQGEITVRGHTVDVDLDLGETLDLVLTRSRLALWGALRPTRAPALHADLLGPDLEGDQTTTRGLNAELTTQLPPSLGRAIAWGRCPGALSCTRTWRSIS